MYTYIFDHNRKGTYYCASINKKEGNYEQLVKPILNYTNCQSSNEFDILCYRAPDFSYVSIFLGEHELDQFPINNTHFICKSPILEDDYIKKQVELQVRDNLLKWLDLCLENIKGTLYFNYEEKALYLKTEKESIKLSLVFYNTLKLDKSTYTIYEDTLSEKVAVHYSETTDISELLFRYSKAPGFITFCKQGRTQNTYTTKHFTTGDELLSYVEKNSGAVDTFIEGVPNMPITFIVKRGKLKEDEIIHLIDSVTTPELLDLGNTYLMNEISYFALPIIMGLQHIMPHKQAFVTQDSYSKFIKQKCNVELVNWIDNCIYNVTNVLNSSQSDYDYNFTKVGQIPVEFKEKYSKCYEEHNPLSIDLLL